MASFGIIQLFVALGLGGGSGVPLGVPPKPELPLMSAVAPEECLFYTTWSAMAQPDPESTNQTEQLLAEPEVQHMVGQLEGHITEGVTAAATGGSPQAAPMVKDAVDAVKTVLTNSVAVFVSKVEMGPAGPQVEAGALICTDEKTAEIRGKLEAYQKMFLGEAVNPVEISGRPWHRITLGRGAPEITWGTLGKYIIVGVGEDAVENIVARARKKPPKWLADLRKQLPIERVSTVSYVNVKGIIEVALPMAGPASAPIMSGLGAFGLDNVTAIGSVTGLDKQGFVSKNLLAISGPPRGALQLLTAEPLTAADLAPIPADSTIAIAARIDADQVLEKILTIAGSIEPRAKEELTREIGNMEDELGISLRDDLLKPLGDTWCVYNSPGEGGLVITGLTAVVQVDDREKLLATQEKLLAIAAKAIENPGSSRRLQPQIETFTFAGQTVHFFDAHDDDFPLAPSWCITEKELIVSAFPQNIKAYLSRGKDYRSLAKVPTVAAELSSDNGPVLLSYIDTQEIFDLVYPFAPVLAQAALSELAREGIDVDVSLLPSASAIRKHLRPGISTVRVTPAGIEATTRQTLPGGSAIATLPVMAGIAFPAVTSTRASARKALSMNNLKQIALAMMMHESSKRSFPAAYSVDEDGEPLLSWRVHILPFIGEQELYKQFNLDEPWNSPQNRKLMARMPRLYESPEALEGPGGMTPYVTIRGDDTAFPGSKAIRPRDIRDGMSRTILVVEAAEQVPWTAPVDYEYDEDDPAEGLNNPNRGGFLAAICDGSVRLIHQSVDPDTLNAMFTCNGGEQVPTDNLDRPSPKRPARVETRRKATPLPVE